MSSENPRNSHDSLLIALALLYNKSFEDHAPAFCFHFCCILPGPSRAPIPTLNWRDLYHNMISFKVIDTFQVRNLTITRNAASIEFVSGEIKIVEALGDRHHAALFTGQGTFRFRPPNAIESDQLHKFTATRILEEPFQSVLLRFSDSTGEELIAAKNRDSMTQASRNESCDRCQEVRNKLLKRYLRNVDSRILRDFYSDKTGYFLAYVFSKSKGEFVLEIDPEQEEEISITQHSRMDLIDVWSSFSKGESKHEEEVSIPHFEVEVDIEKDGKLTATATIDVLPAAPDLKTIAFQFSPLMELKEITDDRGN